MKIFPFTDRLETIPNWYENICLRRKKLPRRHRVTKRKHCLILIFASLGLGGEKFFSYYAADPPNGQRYYNQDSMNAYKKLTSLQAKYLRGKAHSLKPIVFVGQKGLTDALIRSAEEAFNRHELIKIKFIDLKEKKQKEELAGAIGEKTNSFVAGMIGHIAILYRRHPDPEKRKIVLPE